MRLTRLFLTTSFMATYITACGLGTEVGNGLKPTYDPGRRTPTNDTGTNRSPANEPFNDADSPNEHAQGEGSGVEDSNSVLDPRLQPAAVSALLTVGCHSPFALNLKDHLQLTRPQSQSPTAPEAAFITAEYDANSGWWSLRDGRQQLLVRVKPDPQSAGSVITHDANGNLKQQRYTCATSATTQPEVGVELTTVTLRSVPDDSSLSGQGNSRATISWSTSPAGDLSLEDRNLIQVEITLDGLPPFVLIPMP